MRPRPIIELLAYRRPCARCGIPVDVDWTSHPVIEGEAEVWYCEDCCPECNWYDR